MIDETEEPEQPVSAVEMIPLRVFTCVCCQRETNFIMHADNPLRDRMGKIIGRPASLPESIQVSCPYCAHVNVVSLS